MSQMKFSATLDHLFSMLEFIRKEASACGLDHRSQAQLELAAEEALVNVIHYAYPEGEGSVELVCFVEEKDREQFTLLVKDWGIEYNPLAGAKKRAKANSEAEGALQERRPLGGWGILFMVEMADEISYRREEGCNILSIGKALCKNTCYD